jgi:hypothetical protein
LVLVALGLLRLELELPLEQLHKEPIRNRKLEQQLCNRSYRIPSRSSLISCHSRGCRRVSSAGHPCWMSSSRYRSHCHSRKVRSKKFRNRKLVRSKTIRSKTIHNRKLVRSKLVLRSMTSSCSSCRRACSTNRPSSTIRYRRSCRSRCHSKLVRSKLIHIHKLVRSKLIHIHKLVRSKTIHIRKLVRSKTIRSKPIHNHKLVRNKLVRSKRIHIRKLVRSTKIRSTKIRNRKLVHSMKIRSKRIHIRKLVHNKMGLRSKRFRRRSP